MQSSFKSDGAGFLSRADASGTVNDQFSRLQVGAGSFKGEPMGAQGNPSNERDWMNFASNTSATRPAMDRPTTATSNARVTHLEN
jgi:hypothetical protein